MTVAMSLAVHPDLGDELVVAGVVGAQHVVRGPLDHVVAHVQLSGGLVAVLPPVQSPQQDVRGVTERQSELDVVPG